MFMRLPNHLVKSKYNHLNINLKRLKMRRFFYKSILKLNIKTIALTIFTGS